MRRGVLFLASWFVGAVAGAGEPAGNRERPNIVLVVIDTLRADHVGCHGYGRDTTPNMDKLAKEGARFERMFAASSWTIPSVMSLFTGMTPSLHQVVGYQRKLPEGLTTLAAELKAAGYQTAGITSNPSLSGKFGFGKGFDYFDDYTIGLAAGAPILEGLEPPKSVRELNTSPDVNRLAFKWLQDKRDAAKPFFLFLLYIDPHADYVPPSPYDRMFDSDYRGKMDGRNIFDLRKSTVADADRKHLMARYDGEIRYTDEHLGAFVSKLDEFKLAKQTLLVVTSDHGEEFWDHGGMWHGHSLYDELVHVPCVVRWPGRIAARTVLGNQYGQASLMPTLLEAAGDKVPSQCQAPSLLGTLMKKEELPAQTVFMETEADDQVLKALRTHEYKIVFDQRASRRVAFDLRNDPRETKDLAGTKPRWFEELSKRLDEWLELVKAQRDKITDANEADVNKELIERLKEMGYAQ